LTRNRTAVEDGVVLTHVPPSSTITFTTQLAQDLGPITQERQGSMAIKHPIEYELEPRGVPEGIHWINLHVKNVGDTKLEELDIKLNSLDTYCIRVISKETEASDLEPGEEIVRQFRVSVGATGQVYVSMDGQRDGADFHWESPGISLLVGEPVAELVSFLAQRDPSTFIGDPITCEATIRTFVPTMNLVVEFWVETPDGELRSIAKEGLQEVPGAKEITHTFEFTPDQEGLYVLHAYLYENAQRIGHETEVLSVALHG
jgi:hypothetical protein